MPILAFIGTAFVQDDAEAAQAQWRQVADQLRPKVPKLAALMDAAEADVLAFMSYPKEPAEDPLDQSARAHQRRDQAADVVGISPTRRPSCGSSAPSCSNRTTNARCSAPAT
jgi:transposase-like protein